MKKSHVIDMMFIHPMSLSKTTTQKILTKAKYPIDSLAFYVSYYHGSENFLNWSNEKIKQIKDDLQNVDLFDLRLEEK